MNKEDLIRKLSSRKFWVAVVAFVGALLAAFNLAETDIAQITSIIMAGGALIAYIFSEGWVDAARAKAPTIIIESPEPEQEEDDSND